MSDMGVSKKKKSIAALCVVVALILALLYAMFFGITISDSFRIPQALDKERGIRQGLDLTGGAVIVFEAQIEGTPTETEMSTVVSMMQTRLTSLGYTEATVSQQGEKRVRLEIPSVLNPEQAVEELGATAHLTFTDPDGNVLMDGSEVKNAYYKYQPVEQNGASQNLVMLEFTEEGQVQFKEATRTVAALESPNNYLAIMLDDNAISMPTVSEEIDSDSAFIYGDFTPKDAKYLGDVIRAGRLPFALKDVELQSIGPTLGEKALQTSLLAGGIGVLLVLLFMIIVYRLAGLIADIALLAYMGIVLLIMTLFRINLSLPGIAGIILSVGMAVDANVIIFERLKEELRLGKSIGSAVHVSFQRAFSAIIDSNITTLIAAAVLWWKGTGTIQGFAVTLGIGVIVSMFTAIVVTRYLLKLLVKMEIKSTKLLVAVEAGGASNV
ncbi:MAG: protein translocase subunit SecD [Clostridiales bacterium]|jgi:protein-export SecD/SecF family membrane protein|nr:protein translocase subunit SecD [Clostridiales bacterium]